MYHVIHRWRRIYNKRVFAWNLCNSWNVITNWLHCSETWIAISWSCAQFCIDRLYLYLMIECNIFLNKLHPFEKFQIHIVLQGKCKAKELNGSFTIVFYNWDAHLSISLGLPWLKHSPDAYLGILGFIPWMEFPMYWLFHVMVSSSPDGYVYDYDWIMPFLARDACVVHNVSQKGRLLLQTSITKIHLLAEGIHQWNEFIKRMDQVPGFQT